MKEVKPIIRAERVPKPHPVRSQPAVQPSQIQPGSQVAKERSRSRDVPTEGRSHQSLQDSQKPREPSVSDRRPDYHHKSQETKFATPQPPQNSSHSRHREESTSSDRKSLSEDQHLQGPPPVQPGGHKSQEPKFSTPQPQSSHSSHSRHRGDSTSSDRKSLSEDQHLHPPIQHGRHKSEESQFASPQPPQSSNGSHSRHRGDSTSSERKSFSDNRHLQGTPPVQPGSHKSQEPKFSTPQPQSSHSSHSRHRSTSNDRNSFSEDQHQPLQIPRLLPPPLPPPNSELRKRKLPETVSIFLVFI